MGPGGGGGGMGLPAGPPYRTALNHGLPVGAGTDGGNVVTINPWLAFYFMTTGRNAAGRRVVPLNETVTVAEALRLYTIGSAWFSFDEDKLGSLQAGKFADLAALSADILELEESGRLDELRHVSSILTFVDGDIVYSDGELIDCRDSDADGIWYRKARESRCVME
jgi:predicted amidohydrolase YtcJ